jgi:hypothetical protein
LFSLDLKTRGGAALPVEVIHRVDFDAQSSLAGRTDCAAAVQKETGR